MPPRGLLLGLGNPFRGDDGLGVHAVRRFRACYVLPPTLRVLVGGVQGVTLLPELEGMTHLMVVDALRAPAPPGTLVRARVEDLAPLNRSLSVHQLGGEDLLRLAHALGRLPARHQLLGLVPASFALGAGLSPPLQHNLPHLLRAMAQTWRAWGFTIAPRADAQDEPCTS